MALLTEPPGDPPPSLRRQAAEARLRPILARKEASDANFAQLRAREEGALAAKEAAVHAFAVGDASAPAMRAAEDLHSAALSAVNESNAVGAALEKEIAVIRAEITNAVRAEELGAMQRLIGDHVDKLARAQRGLDDLVAGLAGAQAARSALVARFGQAAIPSDRALACVRQAVMERLGVHLGIPNLAGQTWRFPPDRPLIDIFGEMAQPEPWLDGRAA